MYARAYTHAHTHALIQTFSRTHSHTHAHTHPRSCTQVAWHSSDVASIATLAQQLLAIDPQHPDARAVQAHLPLIAPSPLPPTAPHAQFQPVQPHQRVQQPMMRPISWPAPRRMVPPVSHVEPLPPPSQHQLQPLHPGSPHRTPGHTAQSLGSGAKVVVVHCRGLTELLRGLSAVLARLSMHPHKALKAPQQDILHAQGLMNPQAKTPPAGHAAAPSTAGGPVANQAAPGGARGASRGVAPLISFTPAAAAPAAGVTVPPTVRAAVRAETGCNPSVSQALAQAVPAGGGSSGGRAQPAPAAPVDVGLVGLAVTPVKLGRGGQAKGSAAAGHSPAAKGASPMSATAAGAAATGAGGNFVGDGSSPAAGIAAQE
eukprot:scaffold19426_cov19-Tisochrysis_lutea.AAC.1